MSTFAMMHDIGAWLRGKLAFINTAQTAGAASEVDGHSIDRFALASRGQSAKFVIGVQATLASGETVSVSANFQDSPNDSDWTDYGTALAATLVLDAAGGALTAAVGDAELDVDLATAERYIRTQMLPIFSWTGTDTGLFSGVVVVGGAEKLPAA